MPLPHGAGKLNRHRVTIQTSTEAQDAYGDPIPTWTALVEGLPANIRGVSGTNVENGGGSKSVYSHTITIRYRDDVMAGHRIVEGSRTYSIVSVLDLDGRRRWLEMRCLENPPSG